MKQYGYANNMVLPNSNVVIELGDLDRFVSAPVYALAQTLFPEISGKNPMIVSWMTCRGAMGQVWSCTTFGKPLFFFFSILFHMFCHSCQKSTLKIWKVYRKLYYFDCGMYQPGAQGHQKSNRSFEEHGTALSLLTYAGLIFGDRKGQKMSSVPNFSNWVGLFTRLKIRRELAFVLTLVSRSHYFILTKCIEFRYSLRLCSGM